MLEESEINISEWICYLRVKAPIENLPRPQHSFTEGKLVDLEKVAVSDWPQHHVMLETGSWNYWCQGQVYVRVQVEGLKEFNCNSVYP